MNEANPVFCVKAFGGLSITPSGGCTPCCLFEETIKKTNGENFSIYQNSIEEIYTSEFMINLRKKMLQGERIAGCTQCYQIEDSGGESLRTISNREFHEKPLAITLNLDKVIYPVSLDLKMNNKCNLKCRMCQPRDSNLIHEEFKKIIENDENFSFFENTSLVDPDLKIDLDEITDWPRSEMFKVNFLKMLPSLKKISIVGGEPLILDQFYELLEICSEKGVAKNIYLAITTNLMMTPMEKIEKYFTRFDRVLINISLDAVGSEIAYIRYPSNFNKIVENFKKIYEIENSENIILQFSPTVQVYNVITLHKVYEFVNSLLEDGYKLTNNPLNLTFLKYPIHLNIRILPKEIKLLSIKNLQSVLISCNKLMDYKNVKKNLEGLIEILNSNENVNLEKIHEFLYYTEVLDKKRGQRLKDYLPELALGLSEYKVGPPTPSYHKLREQGWKLASEKKYSLAILKFKESLISSIDKYIDFREMAWMAIEIKDYQASWDYYQKAFELNPNDPYIAKGYCVICSILNKKYDLEKQINHALMLNPNDEFLKRFKNS